jgi:hypothetical protein
LPSVEAAQALADLVEISSQIESAVLAKSDGSLLASTLADEERSQAVIREALDLVGGDGNPTQVEAILPEGCVFVVRDDERLVVAVTGRDPTSGLVFYDLKTCLRLAGEEPEAAQDEAAAAPRRRRKKQEPAEPEPAQAKVTEEASDGEG